MRPDPTTCRNVWDALAAQATAQARRPALTIHRAGQAECPSVSFAELVRRAQRRATLLRERVAPGDRVVIALPTSAEFVEVFLACLGAGLVAVPAPPPSSSAVAAERLAGIAADCEPGLIFTTAAERESMASQLRTCGLPDLPVAEPTYVDTGGPVPAADAEPGPGPDSLAVLQYSSGSTGVPRGVMLTQGAILANLTAMGRALDLGSDDVVGCWAPLHHDMGLFAQLGVGLLSGAHVVLMPPTDFVRRPVEWLRLMDRYGATLSAAPNFAFDLCQRSIPEAQLDNLDLSRLRVILNGAEPVHPPTMLRFTERFARIGLQAHAVAPAYGLAEGTVYVSISQPSVRPTVHEVDAACLQSASQPEVRPSANGGAHVVSVGRSLGYELRIVDPETRRVLPGGRVGEVWLSGRGLGQGYWNRPELSRSVFQARIVGEGGCDDNGDACCWLRTGDLGAVLDGELVIVGRLKDVLVVHGRNVSPHDVEHEARAAHDALVGLAGAAFGVSAPDERIVLVHEVSPRVATGELSGVAAAVAHRLTAAAGIPVRNIMLVRRGTVRRTTSGKIQRSATRDRFLAGDIVPVYAALDADVRALVGMADD